MVAARGAIGGKAKPLLSAFRLMERLFAFCGWVSGDDFVEYADPARIIGFTRAQISSSIYPFVQTFEVSKNLGGLSVCSALRRPV